MDPEDARRWFHELTPAGRRMIKKVSPYFVPIYDTLKRQLGEANTLTINAALRQLLDALGYDSHTGAEPSVVPKRAPETAL